MSVGLLTETEIGELLVGVRGERERAWIYRAIYGVWSHADCGPKNI